MAPFLKAALYVNSMATGWAWKMTDGNLQTLWAIF
jgi:hypothetical protein